MIDNGQLDRMVWVDLETMGLDADADPIMEIGFRITTPYLETIDEFEMLVWDSPFYENAWAETSDFVKEMHTKSGLLEECQARGADVATAHEDVMHWLSGHGIQKDEPLCGSSVQFDRGFLEAQYPEVHELFHYRNIDVSTVKELCRRLNPRVYSFLEREAPAKKAHRVLSDLTDTINEFGFYAREFLIVA